MSYLINMIVSSSILVWSYSITVGSNSKCNIKIMAYTEWVLIYQCRARAMHLFMNYTTNCMRLPANGVEWLRWCNSKRKLDIWFCTVKLRLRFPKKGLMAVWIYCCAQMSNSWTQWTWTPIVEEPVFFDWKPSLCNVRIWTCLSN